MDPITIAVGAGIAAASFLAGKASRRSRQPKGPICGCGHHAAMHEPTDGRCHGTVKESRYDVVGSHVGYEYVPCTCQRYLGPTPIGDVWVPPQAIDS